MKLMRESSEIQFDVFERIFNERPRKSIKISLYGFLRDYLGGCKGRQALLDIAALLMAFMRPFHIECHKQLGI